MLKGLDFVDSSLANTEGLTDLFGSSTKPIQSLSLALVMAT